MEEEKSEAPECAIMFTFTGMGSALFTLQTTNNITASQLYALAGWCKNEADHAMNLERERLRQQRNQIAVPRPDLPGDILTAKR